MKTRKIMSNSIVFYAQKQQKNTIKTQKNMFYNMYFFND